MPMGAGAVKEAHCSDNKCVYEQSDTMSSCELCAINFTLLKRKKLCTDCGKLYCSNCMSKQHIGKMAQRRCKRCQLLTSGNFTRDDLLALPVKDLRSFILRRKIPMNNCREKADLVDVLLSTSNNAYYRKEQAERERHLVDLEERKRQREAESGLWNSARSPENASIVENRQSDCPTSSFHAMESETSVIAGNSSDPSHSGESSSMDNQSITTESPQNDSEQETSPQNESTASSQNNCSASNSPRARKLMHLKDLKDMSDIETLSVRQLKEILATNYVVYKGCCEKWELVLRVQRLWKERQRNLDKAVELEKAFEASAANSESEMCKICMDAVIDCVLLDCGHMVACTQCGKQMAECPMCRQYVVRVVHVFKA